MFILLLFIVRLTQSQRDYSMIVATRPECIYVSMHYHALSHKSAFSGFLNMHNAVPICIIKFVFVANLLQKYKFVANICESISWDSF